MEYGTPNWLQSCRYEYSSLVLWCAISEERIIGLYFFENENVTRENYRTMLIKYAFPQFNYLPEDYILQQDGAPPHFSTGLKPYLNNMQSKNWIGRGGPISWLPWSPDLKPCDSFSWRHIKLRIYSTPLESL